MGHVTVASIEAELLVRLGPYLGKVGLPTTSDGSNLALRGPIRAAALALGLTPADPLGVADPDVAATAGFALEMLLDAAELKVLEICWGNWPEYDQSAGAESQQFSQLADRLERRITALTARLKEPYVPIAASGLNPGPSAHGLIRAGRPDGRPGSWRATAGRWPCR